MNSLNVRVYGVLLDHGRILVSDEQIKGSFYTKLPGGGLEPGEGTRDCLKREFKEETGLDISVGEHLYTTDFYQPSAFRAEDQIISIYYYVHCTDLSPLKVHDRPFDFEPEILRDPSRDAEVFRWISCNALSVEDMSLPIDQVVVGQVLTGRAEQSAAKSGGLHKNYILQTHPFLVPVPDGKVIEEHFGLASTGHAHISVAHMVAPPGWSEPSQWPEFDEWTLVAAGKKSIEIDGETVVLQAGQSILISRGARIRYSNPFDEPCDYWSVCLPAFSPLLVHREEEGASGAT